MLQHTYIDCKLTNYLACRSFGRYIRGQVIYRRAGESRCEPAAEGATAPEPLRHPDRPSFNTLESGASAPADGVSPCLREGPGETLRPMTEGAACMTHAEQPLEACAMTSP